MGLRLVYSFVVSILAMVAVMASVCCDHHGSQGQAGTGVTSEPATRPATSRSALSRFEYTQIHLGVPVRLVVYATDETAAVNACRAAYARVRQIDDAASDYRKTSELNQLAKVAATQPVKVSPDLWTLLKESQRLAEVTSGGFDITVGPLVQFWRTAPQTRQLPSAGQIHSARQLVG